MLLMYTHEHNVRSENVTDIQPLSHSIGNNNNISIYIALLQGKPSIRALHKNSHKQSIKKQLYKSKYNLKDESVNVS